MCLSKRRETVHLSRACNKLCKKFNPHRFAALRNCSWVSVANDSLPWQSCIHIEISIIMVMRLMTPCFPPIKTINHLQVHLSCPPSGARCGVSHLFPSRSEVWGSKKEFKWKSQKCINFPLFRCFIPPTWWAGSRRGSKAWLWGWVQVTGFNICWKKVPLFFLAAIVSDWKLAQALRVHHLHLHDWRESTSTLISRRCLPVGGDLAA